MFKRELAWKLTGATRGAGIRSTISTSGVLSILVAMIVRVFSLFCRTQSFSVRRTIMILASVDDACLDRLTCIPHICGSYNSGRVWPKVGELAAFLNLHRLAGPKVGLAHKFGSWLTRIWLIRLAFLSRR